MLQCPVHVLQPGAAQACMLRHHCLSSAVYALKCLAPVPQMEAALACLLREREQAALDHLQTVNSQLRDQLEEHFAE